MKLTTYVRILTSVLVPTAVRIPVPTQLVPIPVRVYLVSLYSLLTGVRILMNVPLPTVVSITVLTQLVPIPVLVTLDSQVYNQICHPVSQESVS